MQKLNYQNDNWLSKFMLFVLTHVSHEYLWLSLIKNFHLTLNLPTKYNNSIFNEWDTPNRIKKCTQFSKTNLLSTFILSTLFKCHEKKWICPRFEKIHCWTKPSLSFRWSNNETHSFVKKDAFPLTKNTLVIFHGLQLCVIYVSSFLLMTLEKNVYYRSGKGNRKFNG